MPRRFIYPETEIMFRVAHNSGCASFHDTEPTGFTSSIDLLVKQGWLEKDGGPYPCGNRTYQRYKLTAMESVASLKARL